MATASDDSKPLTELLSACFPPGQAMAAAIAERDRLARAIARAAAELGSVDLHRLGVQRLAGSLGVFNPDASSMLDAVGRARAILAGAEPGDWDAPGEPRHMVRDALRAAGPEIQAILSRPEDREIDPNPPPPFVSPSYRRVYCCHSWQDCLYIDHKDRGEPCWGQVTQAVLDDGEGVLGSGVHVCPGHIGCLDGDPYLPERPETRQARKIAHRRPIMVIMLT
jgi:hypothetical protein